MHWLEGPLGALSRPPVGRNRRISSNEQPAWNDGNFDMTPLPPGATLEMPVLEGPGVINHIWLTSHAGGVNELDALSLRIFWDDRPEPGVEVPLGHFFAVGQKPAVVNSVPVQVSPSGSLSCYWRMPFAKSARIVVRNDNPDRTTGLYWQVDWVALDALPPDSGYFHARYRQEYPAVSGRDYLIADLRGKGHYVGTVMAVTLAQDGWFGEGDDFFFIDGEEVPSLQGTGSEDYFNDAWGFRERTTPWFGQPRWQGYAAGDSGIMYRWHVLDPVGFEKSLRVAIEHKGNRAESEEAWYIERPDFLSSVAYWYQEGEPSRWEPLPDWADRRVPWRGQHLVRCYQDLRSRPGVRVETAGFFGSRPSLCWEARSEAERLSLPFTVEQSGRHAARLTAFACPEGGRFRLQVDGEETREPLELHAREWEERDLLLGEYSLARGEHRITMEALAPGHFRAEELRLLALPPEANRLVKTHNEAHFVRLGIGRALYAFRLAFGRLPEDIAEAVELGFLDTRYLNDENGHPLTFSREEDQMVAESTEGGWRHAWRGLDARR